MILFNSAIFHIFWMLIYDDCMPIGSYIVLHLWYHEGEELCGLVGERALKIDPNLKRLEEVVQKLDKVSAGSFAVGKHSSCLWIMQMQPIVSIGYSEETELDQPLVLIWQSAFASFSELFDGNDCYLSADGGEALPFPFA
ncbi:hypothetical protein M5K25_021470 [Dendrobium thyrsiflorum]|uniref:Uncharacterized protein n=1 Tax=Dendrobium thyrsiflorum TaxID=117978 RepID=A0ABD0UJT6_DENTH